MPRKLLLNYDKTNRCFTQHYKDPRTGRRRKIYLGTTRSKYNDPEAYKRALKKWHEFQEQLPTLNPSIYAPTPKRLSKKQASWRDRSTALGCYDRYIDYMSKSVLDEKISHGHLLVVKSNLKRFMEFLGPKAIAWDRTHYVPKHDAYGVDACLNGERLIGFKTMLDRLIRNKQITRITARSYLQTIKRFFKWLWEREFIKELPRNINSMDMRFITKRKSKLQTKHVVLFTNDELKALLSVKDSSLPLNLYILLALNCGWTSIDLATFYVGDIRKETHDDGTITHRIYKKRHKTGQQASWILFPQLASALNQYMIAKGIDGQKDQLVFTTRDGKPLVHIKSKGKLRKKPSNNPYRYDAVYTRLYYRMDKLNMTGNRKSFKTFRKQGASVIANLTMNMGRQYYELYLAHAPRDIGMAHYIQLAEKHLDKYILQIPSILNIDEELDTIATHYQSLNN